MYIVILICISYFTEISPEDVSKVLERMEAPQPLQHHEEEEVGCIECRFCGGLFPLIGFFRQHWRVCAPTLDADHCFMCGHTFKRLQRVGRPLSRRSILHLADCRRTFSGLSDLDQLPLTGRRVGIPAGMCYCYV